MIAATNCPAPALPPPPAPPAPPAPDLRQAAVPTLSLADLVAAVVIALACLGGVAVQGQTSFSIDFQGPTMGVFNGFTGTTEGDVLIAAFGLPVPGPVPPPVAIVLPGPNPAGVTDLGLPLYVFPGPFFAGAPNLLEVDALSYGIDAMVTPGPMPGFTWTFSVDEFASGFGVPAPPTVFTQGVLGAGEAAADVYLKAPGPPMPPGPVGPFAWPPSNTLLFDGDGVAPPPGVFPAIPGLMGLGLIEPDFPTPFATPDMGDNLDALDIDNAAAPFPIYFSLDSMYPDPLEFGPVNSGSAAAIGFVGGDVLVSAAPGAIPVLYAPALLLGLDLVGGPDSDDLDALVLLENGTGVYEPSMGPYDWVGGGTDMLLFSVRRGSAIIGFADSFFGLPICEGDILSTPLPGGIDIFGVPGGGGPVGPGIFIAAENLGLATLRSGMATAFPYSDELDALDVSPDCNMNDIPDFYDLAWGFAADCNCNGSPDACDIMLGLSSDDDGDGVPDECALDCNGNGMADVCDIAMGLSSDCDADSIPDDCEPITDCNCNGVADSCDIASGVLSDIDGDGIPGACECPSDIAPAGGNGIVNVSDLLAVIASYGACGECAADLVPPPCGNGVVNVADLLSVIADWGACP